MKKNLIFYCYLKNGDVDESTQLNLKLIEKYSQVFDGEQIIKVAFDDTSTDDKTKDYVRNLFSFFSNPKIDIVKNNPDTRESEYFIESIKEIQNDESLTFFCHNKGNTHTSLDVKNNLFNWIVSMYFFNLDEELFATIERQLLNEATFSGILRKTLDCTPWVCAPWHYSGTFFWFNTRKLKDVPSWDDFRKGRFSVEAYPGQKTDIRHSYSSFVSIDFDFNALFDNSFWPSVLSERMMGKNILNKYAELFNSVTYRDIIIMQGKSKRNLILIPAVTRNPVISQFLSEDERLEQLLGTIKSVKEKVPSSHIVVLEGGTFSEEDARKMINTGADEIFSYDLDKNGKRLPDPNRSKSYGEITLFLEYFKTPHFAKIKSSIRTISKIGGRGILNEKFVFPEDDTCIMNYTHKAWSGRGACSGRIWRIPMKHFPHLLSQMYLMYANFDNVLDIEHGFYDYNVVPLEGLEPEQLVGISAWISGNGKWEEG